MSWPDLIRDVVTVVGAIGGTWLGTWLSNRATNRALAVARRDAAADAVAELTACLDRHRAVMWKTVARRLATAARIIPDDPAAANDDVNASHASRGAITRPMTMLCLRAPALAPHARAAARAAYAMRRATRLTDLERRRAAALRASEDLVDAAGRELGAAAVPQLPQNQKAPQGTGDSLERS
ncbi:MAG TPA: protein kilB [Nonomuraea sp.]|nr:protein kilB [Nonomuraea sp.]